MILWAALCNPWSLFTAEKMTSTGRRAALTRLA
jgi:hypothetical protein